jgi:hypothetical protein
VNESGSGAEDLLNDRGYLSWLRNTPSQAVRHKQLESRLAFTDFAQIAGKPSPIRFTEGCRLPETILEPFSQGKPILKARIKAGCHHKQGSHCAAFL